METQEPSNMQEIMKELQKSGDRLNRERMGPPLKEREARDLIVFGLNILAVILMLGLWQIGRL